MSVVYLVVWRRCFSLLPSSLGHTRRGGVDDGQYEIAEPALRRCFSLSLLSLDHKHSE